MTAKGLFEIALGADWARLPAVTRHIHAARPVTVLEGVADVSGAEHAVGRLLARVFSLPEQASRVPVRTEIRSDGATERYERHYPGRIMVSVMAEADPLRGTIVEHMGPLRFALKLKGSEQGIDLVPLSVAWRRIPLPLALLPRIVATERADGDGRHLFDVHVSLPPFGRLVHYRGWLKPVPPTA
jgi:hypothetical protein